MPKDANVKKQFLVG